MSKGYDQRVIDIAQKAAEGAAKNAAQFKVPPQILLPDIVFAINDALDAGIICFPSPSKERSDG